MSYYSSNLNIYRSAHRLLVHIETCYKKFKRCDKYTNGLELRQMAKSLACKLCRLNRVKEENKVAYMDRVIDDLSDFNVSLNLCEELNVFSSYGEWFTAVEMLQDVNAQAAKLRNYFNERQNHGGEKPQ